MQTDTQKFNEQVTPNSKQIEILKKYFAQCFLKPETDQDGNVIKENFDIAKFTEIINKEKIDIKKEGFTLNFLGKSYAHYQANLDSETVIVPDEQNEQNQSQNIYIVGDNLDALQHLKYSYAEKIKCIYIDPPYNTGKDDFVYNDKFGFSEKDLVEKLDITAEEAERIYSMNGKCTHSAWLTFMYPRLALARELLSEDGVIFISIDDNEQANLKRLCDEVFGEGNFVGEISCQTNPGGNKADYLERTLQYILIYAKNKMLISDLGIYEENELKNYKFTDEHGNFKKGGQLEKWGNDDTIHTHPNLAYSIYYNPEDRNIEIKFDYNQKELNENRNIPIIYSTPDKNLLEKGYKCIRPRLTNVKEPGRWRMEPKTFLERYKHNDFIFEKQDENYKIYEKDRWGQLKFKKAKDYLPSDIAKQNTSDIVELFGKKVFDYTKPITLMKYILSLISNSDIILDFFSGSATTAHAVMKLNAEDGGNRKFIMVQLAESVKKDSEAEKSGYKTIDQIGRERIRRAAQKIKEENPEAKADLGFKTFYLKQMPKDTLDKIKVFDPKSLISLDGNIVKSLGEKTLLQTYQIKDGFGFNTQAITVDLTGYKAYLLQNEQIGTYLYLLSEITEDAIKDLIKKIENVELNVDKIFLYGYSFSYDTLNSIKTNLKTLKNRNPIDAIVRY